MAGATYLFHGDDDFSIAEAVEELKASLGPREALETNTIVLDGRHLLMAELRMTCDTIPFLAEHRLVIVEGLLERFGEEGGRRGRGSGDDGALGEWASLTGYAKGLPATTTLVLTGGRLRPNNPLLRSLRTVAQARAFPALRGARLQEWIAAKANRAGGRLTADATRVLAEFSGGNLRLLDQEIDKLSLFAGPEPITEEMVRQMVSSAREARIFDLMDSAIQRRQAAAMRELERLLVQGEPAPRILTMLTRQIRLMVQAKSLVGGGASRSDLMSGLGTSSDFVVDKSLEQARAYSMDELKALYRRLLEADLSIKTGAVDEKLALELLVAEMAGRKG
ncbi:MAG: DNA polymerase III subunit delta [Dehalococcoidia bacterium]